MGYYNSSKPFINTFSTFVAVFLRLNLKTEAALSSSNIEEYAYSILRQFTRKYTISGCSNACAMDDEADYNVVKKEVFVT